MPPQVRRFGGSAVFGSDRFVARVAAAELVPLDTLAWTAGHDGAAGGTGMKVAQALAAYHASGIGADNRR